MRQLSYGDGGGERFKVVKLACAWWVIRWVFVIVIVGCAVCLPHQNWRITVEIGVGSQPSGTNAGTPMLRERMVHKRFSLKQAGLRHYK